MRQVLSWAFARSPGDRSLTCASAWLKTRLTPPYWRQLLRADLLAEQTARDLRPASRPDPTGVYVASRRSADKE